ncbi:GNAT family N-acetyltransferase [Nostoc flagelliforme FACHB-838]|uniref:GNAT family N-acetyltransferase n=1 Tax=Nostoc flagelliforme FACHB-838 TaxID=2692904 RepID=A0ABR8DYX0_9NOSO|nr:GNAT family N-acetyltransferase [Nostoc flagelliforme]MBD2534333.1 GNAT family N-acetyltransferase [Nostoc flagelliforme FACHB-838]
MQTDQRQNATAKSVTVIDTDIVKLKQSDFAIASNYLAAAFSQDPLMAHFLPEDEDAKQTALKQLSQTLLNYAQIYSHIYTTADYPKGVAIWLPPDASKVTLPQLWQIAASGLITLPLYMRWNRIADFVSFISIEIQLHEKLSPEPHWYLAMLGVSPEWQSQGIGGKLIQPVLEATDRTKTPCYLETSTAAAVRFYQRHGFEIVDQGLFANREYWAMKRNPQG